MKRTRGVWLNVYAAEHAHPRVDNLHEQFARETSINIE